uniref:3-deoxy-D-manno-octulosonic acid transferase n=1 Tax=Candidatus Aschnera chinzeii TaxID=1485666 RepID=A0AAT9G477_9ENTR|nr:MAG: lipid IV(A) 3-deoxy-D-manno-octulosonic acid transferase [Candidatus Aschnera chinzeii]
MGETIAIVPLIKKILYFYPKESIIVTTTTATASQYILKIFGNTINHVYLPYDLYGPTKRFLNKTNPKLVILMEKEIWPNLIWQIKKKKIPLIIINAHLSEHSFIAYKKLNKFIKNILQKFTLIITDNRENAKKFIELGVQKTNIQIIGNLKFDVNIDKNITLQSNILQKRWKLERPIWIAASTHKGEEKIILDTHKQLLQIFPNLLLILVPRHPERFIKVINLVKKLNFIYILRSTKDNPEQNTQVIVADSIGELMLLYSLANIAFVGGSLIKQGGHNPLEAAINSIPIIMGPYIFNFYDICNKLIKNQGLFIIDNQRALIMTITYLLKNKTISLQYGKNAATTVYNNRGVTEKIFKILQPFIISNK